jgi:nucleotide-binding universal stress UspA family protein
MFQRLLCAWDGSDVALRALDVAIDMARRYEGDLTVLSVSYSPAHAETEGDRRESEEAARRYLEHTFAEVRDRALRAGVEVEHAIVRGAEPARAILDHAHEHGADLVICGHHHQHRSGRLLLRGVAERLVSDAGIPVLVVMDDRGR